MGVVPYTINYTNAGSIVNGTGVNATGVVITETVQANTAADLANSTPGWTLQSGSGGAGSTYAFAVGNLQRRRHRFGRLLGRPRTPRSPTGTTTVSNDVSISDAAADQASGTRTTPRFPPGRIETDFQPRAAGQRQQLGIPLQPRRRP